MLLTSEQHRAIAEHIEVWASKLPQKEKARKEKALAQARAHRELARVQERKPHLRPKEPMPVSKAYSLARENFQIANSRSAVSMKD